MSDNIINFPSGYGMKDLIAYGNTAMILLDTSTDTVIKIPHDDSDTDSLTKEQQIYERFVQRDGHKGILIYHGAFESGIRLEYASHGNIRSYIDDNPTDERRKIRWAVQLAEALDFVHQCGVIHGDINGYNVLLDSRLDAKLADFAGSSLDGSPLLVCVTASHEYPGSLLSVEADLFALGSTLYELMAESRPYAGLSDRVIHGRYSKGQFPKTEDLGAMGIVITKCWRGEYKDSRQVVHDLKAARRSLLMPSSRTFYLPKGVSVYTVAIVAAVVVVAASALVKLRLSRGHQPS